MLKSSIENKSDASRFPVTRLLLQNFGIERYASSTISFTQQLVETINFMKALTLFLLVSWLSHNQRSFNEKSTCFERCMGKGVVGFSKEVYQQ